MIRKVYVEVTAKFDTEGDITPLSVTWEDGTVYEIDKVFRQKKSRKFKSRRYRYALQLQNSRSGILFIL